MFLEDAPGGGSTSPHRSRLSITGKAVRVAFTAEPEPLFAAMIESPSSLPAASASTAAKAPASQIELRCNKAWAIALASMVVGDTITVKGFQVIEEQPAARREGGTTAAAAGGAKGATTLFHIAPTPATVVTVSRLTDFVVDGSMLDRGTVAAFGAPGGHNNGGLNTPTGGAAAAASSSSTDTASSSSALALAKYMVAQSNNFANVGKYYDAIYGNRSVFNKRAANIERFVGLSHQVLDAGCGTGLYAAHLRALGIHCTATDRSPHMLDLVRQKDEAFRGMANANVRIRCLEADISRRDWILSTTAPDGGSQPARFDKIICIDVLSFLPSVAAITDAMFALSLQLSKSGDLLVSIPNYDALSKFIDKPQQSGSRYITDRDALAVGAAALPAGVLDVIQRSRVTSEGSAPSTRNLSGHWLKRVTEMRGFATHPTLDEGEQTAEFIEHTQETVITAALFENIVQRVGLVVDDLWGDVDGSAFVATSAYGQVNSASRVYVLRHA